MDNRFHEFVPTLVNIEGYESDCMSIIYELRVSRPISLLPKFGTVILGAEQLAHPRDDLLPVDLVAEGRGDDFQNGTVVQEFRVQGVRSSRWSANE